MKTCVVIGSNCFTGSHLVDALLQDPQWRVIGVSRSPEYPAFFLPYRERAGAAARFTFCQIDVVWQFDRVADLLDAESPQAVINVAALSEVELSHHRPVEYFETNTTAVVRLCDHLRRRGGLEWYVHISSAEVFGSCDAPATEETRFNPTTPYAVSKAAADLYVQALARRFDFPTLLIRSTNVYGAHQQLFKIIPRTIIYLKLGRPIELHGGGRAVKSFIHVRDVARGVLMAMARGRPGAYHFTVPSHQTVAGVVREICEMMGEDFDRVTRASDERAGQDARYWLDAAKARQELGWLPQVRFEPGVREVIAWIDRHWDAVQRESLVYVHKG